MLLGWITLFMIVVFVTVTTFQITTKKRVPRKTVLIIHLNRPIVEYTPFNRIGRFVLGESIVLRDVVGAIDHAAADGRVQGLILRPGPNTLGWATTQEIRDAIVRFRESGKRSLCFAETFGEFSPGNKNYYLATGCDKIWMQESGSLGLTGLASQVMFVKGTLDSLDVNPRIGKRGKYKTAAYTFTHTEFSEAHEEANRAVMESIHEQLLEGVSEARGMEYDRVRELIGEGPFTAEAALENKLVDGLGYRDAAYNDLFKNVPTKHDTLELSEYNTRIGGTYRKGRTIALIYGVGTIYRGKDRYSPLGGYTMGAWTVAQAFRDARDDPKVEAIVFRVNSPGGSYIASDIVWHEVKLTRESGTPVIVSMGDAAASGGFFVSMPATKIVADPATLTGSIGVIMGKMVTKALSHRLCR